MMLLRTGLTGLSPSPTCSATSNPVQPKPPLLSTLLYSLVPIMGVAIIVIFSFWMYRHHKLAYPPVLVPTQVSAATADLWNKLGADFLAVARKQHPGPDPFLYCRMLLMLGYLVHSPGDLR